MIAILACLSAALAIGAGAFGAHGVARGAAALLLAGAAIFALSLYIMALGGPRWLGAVTPIGGTLMIAGWLWAAWTFGQR